MTSYADYSVVPNGNGEKIPFLQYAQQNTSATNATNPITLGCIDSAPAIINPFEIPLDYLADIQTICASPDAMLINMPVNPLEFMVAAPLSNFDPNELFNISPGLLNTFQNTIASHSGEDTSYFSYDAQALKSKWAKKKPHLTDEFYQKIVEIAKKINCDPGDLLGLMNAESGIKASSVNKNGGATGLIQFMPSTAKAFGTSTAALKQMTEVQQLEYVEKFFIKMKKMAKIPDNKPIGRGTLYALVFLPARANSEILTQAGEKYYNANKGADRNKDGKITMTELGERIERFCA